MELVINDTSLRTKRENDICISDLWRSSGGKMKHRISKWIIKKDVKDFIEVLEKQSPNSGFAIWTEQNGSVTEYWTNSKLLMYKYAAWISPEFEVMVYSVFNNYVQEIIDQNTKIKNALTTTNIMFFVDANTAARDNDIGLYEFLSKAVSSGMIQKDNKRYISKSSNIITQKNSKTLMYNEQAIEQILNGRKRDILSLFFT